MNEAVNGIFFLILYFLSAICLWILLSAILLNFYFSRKQGVLKEKKSIVETGSMFAFFIVMVVLVYFKLGSLDFPVWYRFFIAIVGTVLIIAGTIVNIEGRLKLKGNWGNQIRIYEHHALVTTGIYRFVRHPLYASTSLMLIGFALLFRNYLVLIAVILIFVPFMVYRARQEDALLQAVFKDEFTAYKAKTGLFLPRFRK
jgi:protein-S-isoprenylcysteine O-methyltransferase Ste14